jgi:hypothetical protein
MNHPVYESNPGQSPPPIRSNLRPSFHGKSLIARSGKKKEEEAHQAAAGLPSPEVLEKIMRYETKLERQMYRAMAQLERLQRMRQGENIPPPLTMEVSERS